MWLDRYAWDDKAYSYLYNTHAGPGQDVGYQEGPVLLRVLLRAMHRGRSFLDGPHN